MDKFEGDGELLLVVFESGFLFLDGVGGGFVGVEVLIELFDKELFLELISFLFLGVFCSLNLLFVGVFLFEGFFFLLIFGDVWGLLFCFESFFVGFLYCGIL